MKSILLATAAVASMGMGPLPGPTGGLISSLGGGSATSCYHAAVARDASSTSFRECDAALNTETIPFDDMVATLVNRGILKLVRNDYRAAEADFGEATALRSTQPEAWLNKGIARYQQGDFRGARPLFTRALELHTSYAALAYFGRGLANEDAGNVRDAYADYQQAARLDPTWAAPREQLTRFKVVGSARP
jgi:tetratricopeptide (TPR) repeat protein